jgi:PBP1b-binding outer membrane lipoprotein LpoB
MKKLLAVAAVAAVLLTGCAKASEPFKDAERGNTNNDPADTITMPDGFSNVANKCDGPNMVYVIFKSDAAYGSIDVVKDDPRCLGE